MRFAIFTAVLLALVGGGFFTFFLLKPKPAPPPPPPPPPVVLGPEHHSIGASVEGRDIDEYTYGTGATHLVFVGGIHGGYEWNSVLVAYNLKDYLDAHPDAVPKNESVTIILDANPDAVFKVIGKEGRFNISDVPKGDISYGRFNADKVDLNRNFDCEWAPTGTWQNKTVSAGTAPFSEPEAAAIRDYALSQRPAAFVFWHSAAGGVYSSECGKGISSTTTDIMNTYARASGYKAFPHFDAYVVHGASEDWLASQNIPAITVELTSHEDVEWDQNLAGSQAILHYFAK
jgi:predicted deacylase